MLKARAVAVLNGKRRTTQIGLRG